MKKYIMEVNTGKGINTERFDSFEELQAFQKGLGYSDNVISYTIYEEVAAYNTTNSCEDEDSHSEFYDEGMYDDPSYEREYDDYVYETIFDSLDAYTFLGELYHFIDDNKVLDVLSLAKLRGDIRFLVDGEENHYELLDTITPYLKHTPYFINIERDEESNQYVLAFAKNI